MVQINRTKISKWLIRMLVIDRTQPIWIILPIVTRLLSPFPKPPLPPPKTYFETIISLALLFMLWGVLNKVSLLIHCGPSIFCRLRSYPEGWDDWHRGLRGESTPGLCGESEKMALLWTFQMDLYVQWNKELLLNELLEWNIAITKPDRGVFFFIFLRLSTELNLLATTSNQSGIDSVDGRNFRTMHSGHREDGY